MTPRADASEHSGEEYREARGVTASLKKALKPLLIPLLRPVLVWREARQAERRDREKFKRRHGAYPDFENPRSFFEKLMWKKRFDRNPLIPVVADKYRVRDYIVSILGREAADEILIPLLHAGDDPAAIPFDSFPPDYIVKANHGSGWNIIVRGGAADRAAIVHAARQWLRSSFGAYTLEWAYTTIPRRIVVETLLIDSNGQVPSDYKFFVFNGTVKIIQVDFDRFVGHKRNLYDRNWNLLPVHYDYEHGPDVPRPANLERMFELAEKLGKPFDFVRVDFYDLGGRVYFGEMTHYPDAGMGTFDPPAFDLELGSMWALKKDYWKKL